MDSGLEIVEEAGNGHKESDNEALEKDSKRSWLVCFGAIFLVGIAMGLSNSFGVLFTSWTTEFQESRTKIAWVGSFHFIWYMCLCPLCGILTRRYAFRSVVFLGSVLLCLGLLLSSFIQDISVFYLTYGVVFGTGTCLLYMSGIIVLPFCFRIHLATAAGLVTAANSGFTMWCGPMYEYLIRHYGWRVTLRVIASLFIPLVLSCALFPSKKQVPTDRHGTDLNVSVTFGRLVRNKGFVIWVLLMTLVYLGCYAPLMHLVSFCQDIGIPTYISVYNITVMCGMETLSKVVSGKLIDILSWNVHTYNILSLLTMAVSITLLPLARSTPHLLMFATFYGSALGVQSLCVIIITPELCHPDDAKHAVTYLFGFLSVPGGVGPVLAALVFDLTRSYHLAFFVAGGFFACAACLGTLVQLLALRNISMKYDNVLATTTTPSTVNICRHHTYPCGWLGADAVS